MCPPRGPNSFNFMQFWGKFGKNRMLAPPPGELAPPPRGNPGSATELSTNGFGLEYNRTEILFLCLNIY